MPRATTPDHAGAPGRAHALIGICLGFALIILDANVLNVAAPALREDLRANAEGLLWIIDSYTLAFAALLLSAGALGDRCGIRPVFITGLIVFTVASIACALSLAAWELILARIAQGAGAALLAPTSLAFLQRLYPENGPRARALGVWAAISGIAFALGPLVGGTLMRVGSWRSIFLVNVPFGAAAVFLVLRYTRRGVFRASDAAGHLDPISQIIAIGALGAMTFALIASTKAGWLAPSVVGGMSVAFTGGIAFVVLERRKSDIQRLISMEVLRRPMARRGLMAGASFNFGLYGTLFVVTLFLQAIEHRSPLQTGIIFLPLTALHAIVSGTLTGPLTASLGPRSPLVAGLSFSAAGVAIITISAAMAEPRHGPSIGGLLFGLTMFGVGSGLTTTPMTALVLANLPARSIGAGSGLLNASRQLGGLIGVALLGSLTVEEPSGSRLGIALTIACATLGGGALYAWSPVGGRAFRERQRLFRLLDHRAASDQSRSDEAVQTLAQLCPNLARELNEIQRHASDGTG